MGTLSIEPAVLGAVVVMAGSGGEADGVDVDRSWGVGGLVRGRFLGTVLGVFSGVFLGAFSGRVWGVWWAVGGVFAGLRGRVGDSVAEN